MVQLTDADIAALRAVIPVEASNNRDEYFAMANSIINAARASGRSVADEVYSGRYYGLQNDSRAAQENRSNPALLAQVDDAIGRVQRGEPDPTRGATYFEGNVYLDRGKNPSWLRDMEPGGARIGGTTFFVPKGAGSAPQPTAPSGRGIPSWMFAAGNATEGAPKIQDRTIAGYIASRGTPVNVREGIIDRTSTQGMTPQALAILEGAKRGAEQAGLSQIIITAAKGGGHRSHSGGTEWDIKGVNADGSLWTNAQRVAVAEGARQAGADRFGIYRMESGLGAGTLHIGNSGPGRPASVWGANGLTGGEASRAFTNPAERAFLASYQAGKPLDIAALGLNGAPRAPDLLPSRDTSLAAAPVYQPAATPARDTTLAYAPTTTRSITPAAQAATAMATSLPSKGPDMARAPSARDYGFTQAMTPAPRSVQSSDVSRRDMGWMNPLPGAAPMPADRFMSQRDWLGSMPAGPGRSDVARSMASQPQMLNVARQAGPQAPPTASPAMNPANLAAMAALYGQSPKQLGAPILDSRAFRPTPMSAPVKDVRPVYNPPRPAQAPQRAPAAPARTGGNALTRGLQAVTQAARSLTSGDAAQAAVGLLSGYGGGSVPAGGNPSMFAGTGYSWSNPGAYAGGNPYEYAFAATPFR